MSTLPKIHESVPQYRGKTAMEMALSYKPKKETFWQKVFKKLFACASSKSSTTYTDACDTDNCDSD